MKTAEDKFKKMQADAKKKSGDKEKDKELAAEAKESGRESQAQEGNAPAPPVAPRHLRQRPAMKIYIRGNPATQGEPAPKGFLQVAALARRLRQRVHAPRTGQRHRQPGQPADGPRDRQPRLGQALRPRHRRHAEQLRQTRRYRPRHPELLDWLASRLREERLEHEVAAPARSCCPACTNWQPGRTPTTTRPMRQSYLSGVPPPSSRCRSVARFAARRLRQPRRDHAAARHSISAIRMPSAGRFTPRSAGTISNGLLAAVRLPRCQRDRRPPTVTTVPQQQLFALNSEFMMNQAKAFAARVDKSARPTLRRSRPRTASPSAAFRTLANWIGGTLPETAFQARRQADPLAGICSGAARQQRTDVRGLR